MDVANIIETIRRNKAVMWRRMTKQKAIYQVEQNGVLLFVLYHRAQQKLITALPSSPDEIAAWIERGAKKL